MRRRIRKVQNRSNCTAEICVVHMNLKDQAGFVTIGFDRTMDATQSSSDIMAEGGLEIENVHVELSSDDAATATAVSAASGAPGDPDPPGPTDEALAPPRSPGRASRSDSVEILSDCDGYEALLPEPADLVQSTAWAPQSTAESINELHGHFTKFYDIRGIVKQTYFELRQVCHDIQELLTSSSIGESLADKGTETWLSPSEEQTIMTFLRTDPVLIFLGCKGSGKSSVINSILDEEVLPSSSAMLRHACNGLVHLKYDEVGYARITRTNTEKRLDQQEHQRSAHLVREFIEEVMSEEVRDAWGSLENCVLEVGVRNPILRTRVQFLEIPGDCFDPNLRERLLRQLLMRDHQTVMYVIDGNKGLGNSDREFLFFLKANIPSMRIFFIVNKVDYDPEAEEMDCESDNEDSDPRGERFHQSGVQTQRRKQKLVTDQLDKYKLAVSSPGIGRQLVFPVSVLRQKCPLEGDSEQIKLLNQEYKSQYQAMVTALKDCLVDTGRSRMELALSTLFLVAARTFDAFTRDPGAEAGEGARQAEQASKELIQQSFRQTKDKFKECKVKFQEELVQIHQSNESAIVRACENLEFGPLRLYNRIRNNEVEQQYKEQINNYVLHLLNVAIRESLERRIEELKTDLFQEVEKLKQLFSRECGDKPSSPWQDLIRTHAEEIVMGIVKLNFSVEWKAEAGFLKWVRMLWSGASGNKAKVISPNTPQWKSEVAREFYLSIDLNAVVRKMFAGVDYTLKQAESGLLNLANSRHKFAAKLQKLLTKENADAQRVWHCVQLCLVSTEALRNLQARGPLASRSLTEPVTVTCLGELCHLAAGGFGYAGFGDTGKSGVAVTVVSQGDAGSGGSLGGIPNHHLVKGQLAHVQGRVVITQMVTFTDKYKLCVLHPVYRCPLKDYIDGKVGETYSKVQCYQMIHDLLQLWKLFGKEKTSLQWSLKLNRLKATRFEGSASSVLYDYLECPMSTLKKGHAIADLLFAKSEAELRAEKQAAELNNFLELTFMLLVRRSQEFNRDELARIDGLELPIDRHREFKKYLATLTAKLSNWRSIETIPVDIIANFWYTKFDRKLTDIEEWLERNLNRLQAR